MRLRQPKEAPTGKEERKMIERKKKGRAGEMRKGRGRRLEGGREGDLQGPDVLGGRVGWRRKEGRKEGKKEGVDNERCWMVGKDVLGGRGGKGRGGKGRKGGRRLDALEQQASPSNAFWLDSNGLEVGRGMRLGGQ